MAQIIFSPLNVAANLGGFQWTSDAHGDWYDFDVIRAEAEAKKQRDEEAKALKSEGFKVRKFKLSKQLVSRGGIGSRKPHIELVVNSYGLEYER